MAIVAASADSVGGGSEDPPSWREAMKQAVREPGELLRRLQLPASMAASGGDFPVFAPLEFIARMRPADPHDPLLRQVLPTAAEELPAAGFKADPVGDNAARRAAGLIQKYPGRALLVLSGSCAVHCRYCFRRHYPYSDRPRNPFQWQATLRLLREDPDIQEVLLSGGDPLTRADGELEALTERLARIPHLRRLRVHTRFPIMIPQRVTSDLIRWLRGTRLVTTVVVHVNHPAELDQATGSALERLVDAGIPVFNQAVLLRGINDDVEALAGLCERLIDCRVTPYYLHQLDRVTGAAHFEVPEARGRELIEALRARLPGYAVPRYVREDAGAPSKVVLA